MSGGTADYVRIRQQPTITLNVFLPSLYAL
jgi:hypothetical protein